MATAPEHDPFRPGSAVPPPADRSAERANEVPEGTSSEVLDWVGSDKKRAKRALEVEKKQDTPRKTLLARLEDVLK
jgi:hypothetical protein